MRRLTPRRAALFVASASLVAAVAPGVAAAAPATEPAPAPAPAQQPERCPDGQLCTWPRPDFTGDLLQVEPSAQPDCLKLATPTRSAINDTAQGVEFFAAEDCTGEAILAMDAQQRSPSFLTAKAVKFKPVANKAKKPKKKADARPAGGGGASSGGGGASSGGGGASSGGGGASSGGGGSSSGSASPERVR